jgi:hypothetical protein
MKKQRKDYTFLGAFQYQGYEIKVLADLAEILELQLPLALKATSCRNRQVYGPFRVTVKTRSDPKPKRKKRVI